jgi:hypothetical protein
MLLADELLERGRAHSRSKRLHALEILSFAFGK